MAKVYGIWDCPQGTGTRACLCMHLWSTRDAESQGSLLTYRKWGGPPSAERSLSSRSAGPRYGLLRTLRGRGGLPGHRFASAQPLPQPRVLPIEKHASVLLDENIGSLRGPKETWVSSLGSVSKWREALANPWCLNFC